MEFFFVSYIYIYIPFFFNAPCKCAIWSIGKLWKNWPLLAIGNFQVQILCEESAAGSTNHSRDTQRGSSILAIFWFWWVDFIGKSTIDSSFWGGNPFLKFFNGFFCILRMHPWNLTWKLKRSPWKRRFRTWKPSFLDFHVKFRGSIKKKHTPLKFIPGPRFFQQRLDGNGIFCPFKIWGVKSFPSNSQLCQGRKHGWGMPLRISASLVLGGMIILFFRQLPCGEGWSSKK